MNRGKKTEDRGNSGERMSVARRIVLLGLFVSLALVLSWAENFLPLPGFLPGAKLGLANLVTLLALYLLPSWHDAALVLFLRVVLGSLVAGGGAFWYSAVGAAVSFPLMCVLRRFGIGVVGVSAAGGIAHNMGQLAAAMLVLRTFALAAYAPILAAAGLVAGVAVGLLAAALLPRLKGRRYF